MVRRDKVQGLEMYCAVSGLVCTCISHEKGPVAVAPRLLPWVAGRVIETFGTAQGGAEMRSLAERLIQVLCCRGVGFKWIEEFDRF